MTTHKDYIEQRDRDLADDDLNHIIRLKEELVDWLDDNQRRIDQTPKRFFGPNFDEWGTMVALFEEQFNDLWHNEWCRLVKISGSVEWIGNIPSVEFLRGKLARERRIAKEAREAERRIKEANYAAAHELGILKPVNSNRKDAA